MPHENEGCFFFWHCRSGEIPESVVVFGSWNDFVDGTSLKYNGNSMFGETIKIQPNKGTFYYYFDVDGERRTDYTKTIITHESEERNVLQLPLESQQKETSRLFKELMGGDDMSLFKGNTKRTIDDLSKFNRKMDDLFTEWYESSGPLRAKLKSKLRLKLLNDIGCLPSLSMEENMVEFRRNIAVLRLKLKQTQMQNDKRMHLLQDEKEKSRINVQEIWKKEREKWRNIMQQLRTENAALRSGDTNHKMNTNMSRDLNQFCNGNDLSDKDEIIFAHKQKIELLKFEISELKKQNKDTKCNDVDNMMTKKTIVELAESFKALKSDYNTLNNAVKMQQTEHLEAMDATTEGTLSMVSNYSSHLTNMTNKYKEAMQLKRRYFNEIQELKGNIRVYARCRPILPIDGEDQQSVVHVLDDTTMEINSPKNDRAPHLFTFDKIFDAQSNQDTVYKNVSPLIESVMDGYNCCIFAYGQTGSGKTFTMQGDETNPGVNIRALQHLFTVAEYRKPDFEYTISVSIIEIYNEKIRDLLVTQQKVYKIRQNRISGNYVENLSTHQVATERDVLKLMNLGMKNRSVACTNSNETSSRSHMVLTISVTGTNSVAKLTYVGKLHLIDLAGCERVKKSGVNGNALKEAQNINKSLSALGDVISALSKKSKHIPFRNSTLTHMLQDSLGGNSKTLMFSNISPAQNHYGETVNTLKFAQRAKTVELGPTKKSVTYHGHRKQSTRSMEISNVKMSKGVRSSVDSARIKRTRQSEKMSKLRTSRNRIRKSTLF
eukprot:12268_1